MKYSCLTLTQTFTNDQLTDSQNTGAHQFLASDLCRCVAFSDCSTSGDFNFLESTHEDAYTKMILNSINAGQRGAKQLLVFAQDTYVSWVRH